MTSFISYVKEYYMQYYIFNFMYMYLVNLQFTNLKELSYENGDLEIFLRKFCFILLQKMILSK